MTSPRTRAAGLALVAALALLLSSCGGFGSTEPTTQNSRIITYVALGDGFAAGPYAGATTAKDGCLRSSKSYPQLVAKALGVSTFKDVSCVGATTTAITHSFRPAGARKDVKAQIDAVSKDTDLVTISIGIENSNLLGNLFRFCVALPCRNQVPAVNFVKILPAISTAMTSVIREITARAPHAYVVVVGYPELLPFVKNCSALPPMNQAQLYYATKAWNQFSAEVTSSAGQAGAAFIDVRRLTATHPPCTKQPWVNGGYSVASRSIAYHPKAIEQQVVAQAIADSVKTR